MVNSNTLTKIINNVIVIAKKFGWSTKGVSDKWHTFEELYYHRMILFLSLQLAHRDRAWKSKQHHDGTMFEDSFIVGIDTPEGQYTYHYNLKFWELFKDIKEVDKAAEYDGHKPKDINRLLSILREEDVVDFYVSGQHEPYLTIKRNSKESSREKEELIKLTNFEKITTMTKEELADELVMMFEWDPKEKRKAKKYVGLKTFVNYWLDLDYTEKENNYAHEKQ